MSERRMLTTITLPTTAMAVVWPVLKDAGFEMGTVGGGESVMERNGAISDREAAKLSGKMAEALFFFAVEDLDGGEDEEEDSEEDEEEAKTGRTPLEFSAWVYEYNIEEKYQSFHDEYGDAACSLSEYKERHYQEYLEDFESNRLLD